ncbi:peptidyl-tRNA hydrolase [Pseudomonas luteola]
MNQLKVIIRKDLSMPRGKMAAQAAHAAMKHFLQALAYDADRQALILTKDQRAIYESWLNNNQCISFEMAKGQESLENSLVPTLPHSIIVDNGRTHFHGQKTLTCAAQGVFDRFESNMDLIREGQIDEMSRQYFVFSDEHNIDKVSACTLSVISCLDELYTNEMHEDSNGNLYLPLRPGTDLGDWIGGAFTKICLKTDTDAELDAICEQLKEAQITLVSASLGKFRAICIQPCHSEKIQPLLKELRPLMGW